MPIQSGPTKAAPVPKAGRARRGPPWAQLATIVDRWCEPRSFRLRVALALATISLLGAYVSYVASERDATAHDLDTLASQQWAVEQQVEQQFDAVVAQDQRVTARLDERVHRYRTEVQDANATRAVDPGHAADMDLAAQSDSAQYSQLYPFLRTAPDFRGEVATYDADAARDELSRLDTRLFRASTELTRTQARQASDLVSATIAVVVLLVAALFLLTLAHVLGGRRGLALAAAGIALGLGAIVYFTALGFWAAIPVLVAVPVVAIVVLGARTRRARATLDGIDRDGVAGDLAAVPTQLDAKASTNPHDPPASGFSRYVAVTIAIATLLAAGVGFLHSGASRRSDFHAWEARDLGVQAIGALRADQERMNVSLETYQEGLSRHVDAWSTRQRASYATWTGDAAAAKRATADAVRSDELALRYEKRSGLGDELGSAGVSGEAVLRGLQAEVWRTSAELAALQDAENAASSTWGARAGMYFTVLAWLAVAAYLLGLSLIFKDRRVRLLLASVGTLLILAAVVHSAAALTGPEPVSADQATAAAKAYAAGTVMELRSDPFGAEKFFAEATRLRPDFGIANRDRAQAIIDTGSAPGFGLRAAFSKDAVRRRSRSWMLRERTARTLPM